jgi:hypothetical protein
VYCFVVRRIPLRTWGTAATFALLTVVTHVARGASSARLVYSRTAEAESCPDEDALRRAVATRVGYDTFFPWAKRTIVATIARTDGAFVATVDLVDEDGIRHGGHQLRTEGACAELLDAVALAVAIAIDPKLLLAVPPPKEAAPEPAPTEAAPAVPVVPERTATPPSADRNESKAREPSQTPSPFRFEASLGAAGAIKVTPSPTFGGTLGGAVRWKSFSLGLEGFIGAPASSSPKNDGTLSAWPVFGALVPCAHLGPAFGCAVAEAGAVYASGEGSGAKSSPSAWVSVGGRIGALVPIRDRFFVRARVDLLGDATPANFFLNGMSQWKAPLITGSLGADAVVRFP